MVFKYGDYKYCSMCNSKNFKVVKRVYSNGAIHYQYQCQECGCTSASIKTDTIPQEILNNVDYYEENLYDKYKEKRQVANMLKAQEVIVDYQKQKEEERECYFTMLQKYYQTSEWKYRRQKRLEYNKLYFGGKCERCRKNDAVVVHHRSYKVLGGMEHTFDLEALCEDCHKLLHKHLRED